MKVCTSATQTVLACILVAACSSAEAENEGVPTEPNPSSSGPGPTPSSNDTPNPPASPPGPANDAPGPAPQLTPPTATNTVAPGPDAAGGAPSTSQPSASGGTATNTDGMPATTEPEPVAAEPTGGTAGIGGTPTGAGGEPSGEPEPAVEPRPEPASEPAPDSTAIPEPEPPVEPEPLGGECPDNLEGWATLSGDGVDGTTGGGNAAPVRPTSADELLALASDDQARVIEIAGTFDVPRLDVASNKTFIGVGTEAALNGGIRIRGYADDPVHNVVFRNLTVNGATTQVDDDAVQVYFAHHIWIDHCDIFDGRDGNLDLTHAVNWVTVSWTRFHYTSNYSRPEGESSDHRFSSLVGHSDNNAEEDDGRLKISFHHNWWDDGVIERMPRVRFGEVHVYNNYFSSADSNYCVRAGVGARLLIEANYFDNVNSPHEFNEDDATSAHITARDNEYDNTTGQQATGGEGAPFTDPPYDLNLDAATAVKALVRECAGPR
jgi:pectate lyase